MHGMVIGLLLAARGFITHSDLGHSASASCRHHSQLKRPGRLGHVARCCDEVRPWECGSGVERLTATVDILTRPVGDNGGCHWTAEQNVTSVLGYLRDELDEVETALGDCDAKALLAECGDVLFNSLLLAAVIGKASDVTLDEVARRAALKFQRRTPYMQAWGSGAAALSRGDCERAWNEAKAAEQ